MCLQKIIKKSRRCTKNNNRGCIHTHTHTHTHTRTCTHREGLCRYNHVYDAALVFWFQITSAAGHGEWLRTCLLLLMMPLPSGSPTSMMTTMLYCKSGQPRLWKFCQIVMAQMEGLFLTIPLCVSCTFWAAATMSYVQHGNHIAVSLLTCDCNVRSNHRPFQGPLQHSFTKMNSSVHTNLYRTL